LLAGFLSGLRAATPLAVIGVAAALGWLNFADTWAAFIGHPITAGILVVFAVLELVGDKLPTTPSRKLPAPFISRVIAGAIAGLLLALPVGMEIAGAALGAGGAALGTLAGHEGRRRLAAAFGRDLPAALTEDALAIAGSILVVLLAIG